MCSASSRRRMSIICASIRVMEKLGMTLRRRFRLTPEDLANVDTFHADSLEIWDGDDVEYAVDRNEWEEL